MKTESSKRRSEYFEKAVRSCHGIAEVLDAHFEDKKYDQSEALERISDLIAAWQASFED